MKNNLRIAGLLALCIASVAYSQVAVKYNGAAGQMTEPVNLKVGTAAGKTITFDSGGTGSFAAGSTLSVLGTFNATPTAGTLNLSAVTLTLPSALTGINSITSTAGQSLVLATGTSGTALSIASATNLATFSNGAALTLGNLTFAETGKGLSLHDGGAITGASGAISLTASGTNQNITLTPSGSGFTLLGGNTGLGTATPGAGLTGRSFEVWGNSADTLPRIIVTQDWDTNSNGAFVMRHSRSGGTVVSGDWLGQIDFSGHDGTNWVQGAYIGARTTGTIATGQVPTGLLVRTRNLAGTLAERFNFSSEGNLLIGGGAAPADINGTSGLKVFGTTAATSTTTGSLINAGGFGNAGTIYSGGPVRAAGIQSWFQADTTTDGARFYIQKYSDIWGGGTVGVAIDALNSALGATVPLGLRGLTVRIDGNVTLDDDLTVSGGNVGVGGATSDAIALWLQSTALTGTTQLGLVANNVAFTSAATARGASIQAGLRTAASAFTMTDGAGIKVLGPSIGAGSAVTNHSGISIDNQGATGITNAYGIDIAAQSGAATTNVGLRNAGTTLLTNTLQLSSAATSGLQLYNTEDQTTNYERLEALWNSNVATIRTWVGGTGTGRKLRLSNHLQNNFDLSASLGTGGSAAFSFNGLSQSSSNYQWVNIGNTNTATSGSVVNLAITPAYNQTSGTAANTDLLIQRTETAVGSGAQYLIQAGTAAAPTLFTVGNTGKITTASAAVTAGSGTGVTVNETSLVTRTTYKVTTTYAAFSAADVTADKTIATLPAKTKLVAVYADCTATFGDGAVNITDADFTLGNTAGGNQYLATFDAFTATGQVGLLDADLGTEMTRAAAIQGGAVVSWGSTTDVTARLTVVGANTSTLTTGSITWYLVTEMLP